MVTDFQDRLRQIREEKDRESQLKQAQHSAGDIDRIALLELRFDRRERIEKVIHESAESFLAELPSFTRSKSFFEGKYKIEVTGDDLMLDENSQLVKSFSRVMFLLDPNADGQIRIQCRKTAHNRDLESATHVVRDEPDALERFQVFVEDQFVSFANAYFSAGTRPTR